MDHKEKLKDVLQSYIHDDNEKAVASLHDYFIMKGRQIGGFGPSTVADTDTAEDTDTSAE